MESQEPNEGVQLDPSEILRLLEFKYDSDVRSAIQLLADRGVVKQFRVNTLTLYSSYGRLKSA